MSLERCQFNPSPNLGRLLSDMTSVHWDEDFKVSDLCFDSRKVRPGSLFFAIPGGTLDGRSYIQQAIEAGASAILFEKNGASLENDDQNSVYGVSDLRSQIGFVADTFYNHPTKKIHVIGITGTNAKSTSAILAAQALNHLGKKCGVIGTLGTGLPNYLQGIDLTTPDPIELQKICSDFVAGDTQFICMEVSSHALDQGRTHGVRFDTVVFTNLSQDHMDYHGSVESYRESKSKLFHDYPMVTSAVLNVDDELGSALVGETIAPKVISYGTRSADVQLVECDSTKKGLDISIVIAGETVRIKTSLLGRLNGINVTAVAAILHAMDIDIQDIGIALNSLTPVMGRLEQVSWNERQPTVIVDFAHTPHALESVLSSLAELTDGLLWCVFGCGGDRDREKRSLMGVAAELLADRVIVTNDNPRSESACAIVEQIVKDMTTSPQVILDRREAIRTAITEASPNDTVLIAGKGHESVQIYGNDIFPFNDRQVATELLEDCR